MQFSFEFGGEPQDLLITLSGSATPQDLRRMNADLISDPRYRTGLAILVDLSQLDASGFDDDGFRFATEPIAERDWEHPPLAIAILAPDQETFDAARLYAAYLGGSASGRAVFRTRVDAIAWLRDQRGNSQPEP
ncbi:MAG TPA: hypothetical protein VGH92_12040 [Gaiellaceae bacterium]